MLHAEPERAWVAQVRVPYKDRQGRQKRAPQQPSTHRPSAPCVELFARNRPSRAPCRRINRRRFRENRWLIAFMKSKTGGINHPLEK